MGAKLLTIFWAWLALSNSFFVSRGVVSAAIPTSLPDLYEASVIELQAGLTSEQFTSVDLIKVRKHVSIRANFMNRLGLIELRIWFRIFGMTGVFRPHRGSQSEGADASRCD